MRTATPRLRVSLATRRADRRPFIALVVFAVLIGATAVWGSVLDRTGEGIALHAAPLFAAWQPRTGLALLAVLTIAALVVWKGTDIAERMEWRRLLVASVVLAAAWGMALALVDPEGVTGLTRGVSSPQDFLASVDAIRAPGPFLETFTERIDDFVVHVRGHPPALGVVLWWMQRIGLGGAAPFVGLLIAAGAATVVAALTAVREIAGERSARAVAPFVVLSPAAIWLVTSADALYAGLGAIGLAAIIASTGRVGPRSDVLAAVGGVVLGLGMFFSYGLVLLGLVPVGVALARRRVRPLVVAGVAVVAVGAAFAAFGFSWVEGLWATRAEYAHSIASVRPYTYFVVANLAALAIALGPAPIAGLATLRDRRLWLLVGPALAAALVADLSGLSKGEVERIWLPFLPWILIAAGALVANRRWWLGAQAAVAIAVQSLLGTPW